MGLTPVDFFTRARFEPAALAVLILAAAWYVLSVRRLHARGRRWPAGRSWCFAGAWLGVAVPAFSGLDSFAPTNFSAYVAIYISAALVAPVLLGMAAPLQLMLLVHPERSGLLDSVAVKVVANPFVTWIVYAASMFVLFFTGLLVRSMYSSATEQVVYLGLIVVGYLHYWPAVDVDPRPTRLGFWPRILYLLLDFPLWTIVGMALESAITPLNPVLTLASLHLGAAVVWVAGETVALGGAIAVFVQWLRADQRRARANDLAHQDAAERQLALWRASRDAAARAAGPLN